jgi:hypothetical protein
MVERSLSMREVPGSIPGASKCFFFQCINQIFIINILNEDNCTFTLHCFNLHYFFF